MANLEATPNTPSVSSKDSEPTPSVKPATPDIILFDEQSIPIDLMTDMIFQDIGGQELINIVRSDLVTGQDVLYQPIKNLSNVYFQYNPQNILGLQDIDSDYFQNFSINFASKIPLCGTGPSCAIVYIDPLTGDLVINAINLAKDEKIEVSIVADGKVLDDTIY